MPRQSAPGQEAGQVRPTQGSACPTWPPLVLIFLGESDVWAHVKIPWCICLVSPVFSDMWALLVSDTSQC